MKKLIWTTTAGLFMFAAVAQAATETVMKTYPTRWRLIYDTDRDSLTGDTNYLIEGVGDQLNGRVAGGTGTGLVTVYGNLDVTGSTKSYFFETFGEGAAKKGIKILGQNGAAYVTTTIIGQLIYTGNGNIIGLNNLGAQTLAPVMVAGGLDISADLTTAEGVELVLGYENASGRAFVVGTDPAFYTCATFTVADASEVNPLVVGFRTLEVANATIANYLEYAYLGIVGSSNPNVIQIVTEVDAALDGTGDGATTTDTTMTWADAASKKLCVYASGAGVLTYTVNDAAPTVTAAKTLTDGQIMVPFIYELAGGTPAAGIVLNDWEVGYQKNAFQ